MTAIMQLLRQPLVIAVSVVTTLTVAFLTLGTDAAPGRGNKQVNAAITVTPTATATSTATGTAILTPALTPTATATATVTPTATPTPTQVATDAVSLATPSAGESQVLSNRCDEKHPTIGNDTDNGEPGTPGHNNPMCQASPAESIESLTPTPTATVVATDAAEGETETLSNRCDEKHPDRGNDTENGQPGTPGHNNPKCQTSTDADVTTPADSGKEDKADRKSNKEENGGGNRGNSGGNGNAVKGGGNGQGGGAKDGGSTGGGNKGGSGKGGGKKGS